MFYFNSNNLCNGGEMVKKMIMRQEEQMSDK